MSVYVYVCCVMVLVSVYVYVCCVKVLVSVYDCVYIIMINLYTFLAS